MPRPVDHVEWSMELTVRDLMWRSSAELDAEMTKLATRVSADLLDDLLRSLAFRAVRGGWDEICTLVADQRHCDAIGAIAVVVDKARSRELAKPEYDDLRVCLQPYDLVVVDQFPPGSDWQQASALLLPMPTNAQLHRVLPPTLGWRRSGETQARFVVTSRSALELGQPAIAIATAIGNGSLVERVGDAGLTLSTGRGRRRR